MNLRLKEFFIWKFSIILRYLDAGIAQLKELNLLVISSCAEQQTEWAFFTGLAFVFI